MKEKGRGGKEQERRRREEMQGEGRGKYGRRGMKHDKSEKGRREEGGWGRCDGIFGSLDLGDP